MRTPDRSAALRAIVEPLAGVLDADASAFEWSEEARLLRARAQIIGVLLVNRVHPGAFLAAVLEQL